MHAATSVSHAGLMPVKAVLVMQVRGPAPGLLGSMLGMPEVMVSEHEACRNEHMDQWLTGLRARGSQHGPPFPMPLRCMSSQPMYSMYSNLLAARLWLGAAATPKISRRRFSLRCTLSFVLEQICSAPSNTAQPEFVRAPPYLTATLCEHVKLP